MQLRLPSKSHVLSFCAGYLLSWIFAFSNLETQRSRTLDQSSIFNLEGVGSLLKNSLPISQDDIKNEKDPVADLSHEFPSDHDDTPHRIYTGRERPPIFHTNGPAWEPMHYSNIMVLVLCAPKYMATRSIPMHRTWASQVDDVYYMIAPWENFAEHVAGFSEEDQASVNEMNFVDIGTQFLDDNSTNIEGMMDGKWKVLPSLKWAWEAHPDFEWYLVVDDDTYMIMENTMYYLNKFPKNETAYLGVSMVLDSHSLAFIQGGSGIMLNQLAVSIMYDWIPECIQNDTDAYPYGDAILGACLKKYYPDYKVGTNRHTQFSSSFPYQVLWKDDVPQAKLYGSFHVFRGEDSVDAWYDMFKVTQQWSHIPRITAAELEAYLPRKEDEKVS